MQVGKEHIVRGLRNLGVRDGDILFIHSSFKSLGPVCGGAAAVIAALEDAVGRDGLVLMPSFNLVEHERRAVAWNIERTPSTVGWLTEFFRRMPGTLRSNHYSHSVAARGRGAREFVSEHLSQEGLSSPWDLAPWGKTFGARSPMWKAYKSGGKLLMLGVHYESSTYVHLVEVLWWNRRLQDDPAARYISLDRPRLGRYWDELGDLRRGKVARAECRLFTIRTYVDTLLDLVEDQQDEWRC